MFNEEILKGKWPEIKIEIKSQWRRLTENEIEQTNGNLQSLFSIIEQRYGARQDEIQVKLDSIAVKFTDIA